MGREIKRVPLDFDAPEDETWQGYVMPNNLRGNPCPGCQEEWLPQEPPEGPGWQLWQTVSDAPLSPVFATGDELIEWMTTPAAKRGAFGPWTWEQAAAFVNGPGRAPSMVYKPDSGLTDGITAWGPPKDPETDGAAE